jgi:hypothetical protein
MRSIKICLLLAGSIATFPGCGSSESIKVTGRILKGNTPLVVPPDRKLGITLIALEQKDATSRRISEAGPYPAHFDPVEGTFRVPGPDGYGIPPGKYRFALRMRPTREALNIASYQRGKRTLFSENDALAGKFRADNSPIIRDLRSPGELTIELDRPSE